MPEGDCPHTDESLRDQARAISEALKMARLESAAAWVKRRRAKLPRLPVRRLPAAVVPAI